MFHALISCAQLRGHPNRATKSMRTQQYNNSGARCHFSSALRSYGEPYGVTCRARGEGGAPVLVQLAQHIIADLAWQCARGLVIVNATEDLRGAQGDALMNEGLTRDVAGGVVEVLGGEGGLIYCGLA